MTAPEELRTTRLLLRPFAHEDIPTIARLAGTREVSSMTANIPHPYTERDARDFLARASDEFQSGQSMTFAICVSPAGEVSPARDVSATRELIGAVGLILAPAHHRAELGYWIGVPFWGNGFATEAAGAVVAFGFETLGLHRIYAFRFAENVASGRVLTKIGMRHEGRSREHVKKWDRFIDLENYGLLRSEFREEK
jgi:RimJ/RimL family protein N-acetyltransferase